MIRYDIAPDALDALVEERAPGWLERARSRSERFREKGKYEEKSSIWGEVKPVFMEVQGGAKCCFCERQFEAGDLGRHELDLEHYRPKGKVKRWKCPPELVREGVSLTEPPGSGKGYHLLAYHLLNYAAACKACNSGLKKDCFPIAGEYDLDGDDPGMLTGEEPWLLYPLGRLDVDPEEVITFHGIFPNSTSDDQATRLRGLVMIAFFGLDDVIARKNLMKERAHIVCLLHPFLVRAEERGGAGAEPAAFVETMLASTSPHANCARSFARLFRSDPAQAAEVAGLAATFLLSGSP